MLKQRTAAKGVTLIEVVVVSAIIAIMAAIAAPAMQAFIREMQLRTATNDLSTAMAYARSEAIKRGWPVTVCKSSNTGNSTPSCAVGANWQDGWIVFVDSNGDGAVTTIASSSFPADTVLRARTAAANSLAISGGTNYADYVSYDSRGVSKGSGGLNNGTFTLCHGGESRSVVINTTGRTSIQRGSC